MLSFEDLTEARRSLQTFCLLHVPSLMSQHSGVSFKLHPTEGRLSSKKVRHLTTTATCLSSLLDCPPRFFPKGFDGASDLCSAFASKALLREKWKSEGSGGIYCRSRALPLVIRYSGSVNETIEEHLGAILFQLNKQSDRFGVGEADPSQKEDNWYPPNAFHTYWALEILDLIRKKFRLDYDRLSLPPNSLDIRHKHDGMLLWARQELGDQIALHSASPQSSMLDSDQLGWSLAIFLKFDEHLHANLEKQDFAKQALKCLFSTQIKEVGSWRHYKPLFHYKEAGNAYCYVFETFTVLLECALQPRPEAEIIRQLLKPYSENLLDLWRFADSTKIPLPPVGKTLFSPSDKIFGWCSGHRTNITSAESWATASVFSYAQALRKLFGIWCREEALSSLNTPQSQRDSAEAAKDMADRGKTWGIKTSISEQLRTLFINRVRMHTCTDRLEPDSQPVEKNQARSAILFGPPGTSKTTLVRALADVIGWKYVEIHASHFVKQGLAQVQKTADEIFKQLLELDHTVVLFDEIDELVRERDIEKDAFGRFLTTSMLPKLAELWEARKILYFVATNHINYFDSAIIRSHRFDALILVSPPSFEAKIEQLQKLLSETHRLSGRSFTTQESEIREELNSLGSLTAFVEGKDLEELREQRLDSKFALAKFALLRWDELEELASRLARLLEAKVRSPKKISTYLLREALENVADSEWRKNKSYFDFLRDTRSERRDYQMLNAWEVTSQPNTQVPGLISANRLSWLARAVDSPSEVEISGFNLQFTSPGCVSIRASRSK
jgi:predicted ATPase